MKTLNFEHHFQDFKCLPGQKTGGVLAIREVASIRINTVYPTEGMFLTYKENTFYQGVHNDGGSHVETSLICVVPLVYSIGMMTHQLFESIRQSVAKKFSK